MAESPGQAGARALGREVTDELAAAVKAYAAAVRAANAGEQTPPAAFTADHGVTPTDVVVVVDALLRAADLDLFEVQMWRSLGRA